ncbi:MAG: VanZ family protein [bacterium]
MRKLVRYFVFLYTAIIFGLSLLSSSKVERLKFITLWDKISHTIEYAIWGVLAYIFIIKIRSDDGIMYVVFLSGIIGAIDETIQRLSMNRSVSFWDFSVDVFGAFLGTVIFYLISRSIHKN